MLILVFFVCMEYDLGLEGDSMGILELATFFEHHGINAPPLFLRIFKPLDLAKHELCF